MNKLKLKSSLNEYSIYELRKLGHLLNEFCEQELGIKKTKGLPQFKLRNDYTTHCYGQYSPVNHSITLFLNQIGDLKMFIRVFIHEYTHSVQNLRYYRNRLAKFGYSNHPDEIESEKNELIYYKKAFNFLKNNI